MPTANENTILRKNSARSSAGTEEYCFGLKKLPTVKSLNEEFARLLTEKKAAYADYHKTQEQMRDLLIHKANAAYLLGTKERKQQTAERQREDNSDGTSRSHR